MAEPIYDKLLPILEQALIDSYGGSLRDHGTSGMMAKDALDAIWPEIEAALKRKPFGYVHPIQGGSTWWYHAPGDEDCAVHAKERIVIYR